jgi:phosphoenolpyruvate synthase/pyruvate phosphate dikinase
MNAEIESLAKQKWYTQGFGGRPAFLVIIPSVDIMHKGTGFCYQPLLSLFKEDYCEFNYLENDFEEHADIIMEKLAGNPNYLKEKRNQFNREVEAVEKTFKQAENAQALPEEELFKLVLKTETACETTAGTAHLLESISLRLEKEIGKAMSPKASGKELNKDFAILTSPITRSFVSKKEDFLWLIKNSSGDEKEKLIQEFVSKFFWIKSSYTGSSSITEAEILEEVSNMKKPKRTDFETLKEKKKQLFEKYAFKEEEKQLVHLTEFLIEWQDDRKAKIFRGIFAIEKLFQEISKRYNVPVKQLHYLLPREIPKALKEGNLRKIPEERMKGCAFARSLGRIEVFTGKEFLELEKALEKEENELEIITGSTASLGTAVGKVKVCKTIESLEKVQEGDILVASMTRPEFVQAMKKAAAVVTDEGGVLCHAAIICRELGIPCVVGTKIATKVLKDGEIVEVRANHGMVRKIK